MRTIKVIWNILGGMSFALWSLLFAAVLCFAGSICYGRNPEIFVALNSTMLRDWLETFGVENIAHTWWLFLLLGVLFFLGINTALCTAERMIRIMRLKKRRSMKAMLFLLAPHIMHIAFLVIMAGYLALYTSGINSYNNILGPGIKRYLPGSSIMMELSDPSFSKARHQHNEYIEDLYVEAGYKLLFHDGNKTGVRRIGLNRPCFYRGYSIHVADFNPKKTTSMTNNVWVNLTIRKNMGIPLFMAGVIIFALGVFLYTLSVFTKRK